MSSHYPVGAAETHHDRLTIQVLLDMNEAEAHDCSRVEDVKSSSPRQMGSIQSVFEVERGSDRP